MELLEAAEFPKTLLLRKPLVVIDRNTIEPEGTLVVTVRLQVDNSKGFDCCVRCGGAGGCAAHVSVLLSDVPAVALHTHWHVLVNFVA